MDNILDKTIQQIKQELDEMNLSNIQVKKENFKEYMIILDALSALHDRKNLTEPFQIKKEVSVQEEDQEDELSSEEPIVETENQEVEIEIKEEKQEEEEEEEEVFEHEIDSLASVFDDKKQPIGYPFEQKLSGGFLIKGTPSENIFVPESIVRELELKNGDLVAAEVVKGNGYRATNHHYTVIERTQEEIPSARTEFKYAIVEYDTSSHRFVISEDINKQSLRMNDGSVMTYIVKDREAEVFSLVHGDIVDIAWYGGSFEKAKVIWKHRIEPEEIEQTQSSRMLNRKKDNTPSPKTNSNVKQTLKGKRICLIGLEPKADKYRKLVEERGGILDDVESERHKTSMSASIRKADLVVVGISHTSHDASIYAAARSKHYGVPFTSITGFGGESFVKEVESKLLVTENA